MVATKYSYVDTVDVERLAEEIRTNSLITTALDYITIPSAGNVDVWFRNTLSNDEETELGNVISSHVPTPMPDESINVVEVLEQPREPEKRTGGHFQATTIYLDVPAGSVGDKTSTVIVFPFPIALLAAETISETSNKGDLIDFVIAPDTIIGAITQDVSVDDTVIHVSPTVLSNGFVGVYVNITDLANMNQLGRIVEIAGDHIIVETAATQAFSALSPTYVRMTVKMTDNLRIPAAGRIEVGGSKIGGSFIPANTQLKLTYTNNGTEAKTCTVILEYLY